uniref:Uncharacterized protein n=1 Tax=Zea mays TaxID=4577 RepID=A0A804MIC1_MAIZE
MQQLGHDLDQEEPRTYRHSHVGSPIANSPPGTSVGTSFKCFQMLQRLLLLARIATGLSMIKCFQMVTSPWELHFSTPTHTKITTVNT